MSGNIKDEESWIVNTGELPVEKGVLVDVKHRSGNKFFNQSAGEDNTEDDCYAEDWSIDETDFNEGDIILWRLHEEGKGV